MTASTDGFVAKLDLDGHLIWIQEIVGSGVDYVRGIGYDSTDNIFIIGSNSLLSKIDSITIPNGVFIAKIGSNGNLNWVKNVSGQGDYPGSIAFNPSELKVGNNSFYISGGTSNDTLLMDSVLFANPNRFGTLIAKFSLAGNLEWAKITGYAFSVSFGYSMALDDYENLYFTSTFSDSAIFDSLTIYSTFGALGDNCLIKFDKGGNFKWVSQINCTSLAEGYGVAVTNKGDVYVSGKMRGSAQFGGVIISSTNGIPSLNNYDGFLAAYDTNGNCLGVDHFGYAEGVNLMIDNSNNPIVSGRFYNTVNIGSNAFTAMGTNGGPDAFIAKHDAITGIPDPRRITNNQLFIHANPNEGRCNITVPDEFVHEKNLVLSIYNSSGKLIQQKKLEMNEGKIKLSLEAEAKGLYNAVLSNGLKSYSGKIVFE